MKTRSDELDELDDKVKDYYLFENDIHKIICAVEQSDKFISIENAHSIWKQVSVKNGKNWAKRIVNSNSIFLLVNEKYLTKVKNHIDPKSEKQQRLRREYAERQAKGLGW